MIETLLVSLGDEVYVGALTLFLGALYAVVWFGVGGLWVIWMVRRGRLVVPPG